MAYEDDTQRNPSLIFLAGPIKYWWTCWESERHLDYVDYRDALRGALVREGYLTYAPWDAFKGAWTERAQAINDAAISASDLLVVMTPAGIPADGTEEETTYAVRVKTPYIRSSGLTVANVLWTCRQLGLTATPY